MFNHILLPTDGSPLSELAIRRGMEFAKSINARVTGFCVIPEFLLGSETQKVLTHTGIPVLVYRESKS